MIEAFYYAVEEFKRVHHLFYVSLKYTRTVDVIKNTVERMIACMEYCFKAILKLALDTKKIDEIPKNIALQTDLIAKLYPDDEVLTEYIAVFKYLRKIVRAHFQRRQEFRRHVTMIATLDSGEVVEVTIDVLKEYFDRLKIFMDHVKVTFIDPNKEAYMDE